MSAIRLVIALSLLAVGTQAVARPQVWKNYINPRFAFRVCYPDSLKPGPVSGNGDGRIFTDRSGGEMRVFGSYASMVLIDGREELSDEAPASTAVKQAADYDAKSLGRVTYRAVGTNWYVVSGRSKGRIVYFKTVTRDDRWISLQFNYPASAAPQWNPLIKHIASCLEVLPPLQFIDQAAQPK